MVGAKSREAQRFDRVLCVTTGPMSGLVEIRKLWWKKEAMKKSGKLLKTSGTAAVKKMEEVDVVWQLKELIKKSVTISKIALPLTECTAMAAERIGVCLLMGVLNLILN